MKRKQSYTLKTPNCKKQKKKTKKNWKDPEAKIQTFDQRKVRTQDLVGRMLKTHKHLVLEKKLSFVQVRVRVHTWRANSRLRIETSDGKFEKWGFYLSRALRFVWLWCHCIACRWIEWARSSTPPRRRAKEVWEEQRFQCPALHRSGKRSPSKHTQKRQVCCSLNAKLLMAAKGDDLRHFSLC